MIKVFIVDDSLTFIEAFRKVLSLDPEIEIVGYARTGQEAIERIPVIKPDVVTMDIIMPGLDGIDTTKRILQTYPVPIVIISSCYNDKEVEMMYEAIQVGAVSIIAKPRRLSSDSTETLNLIRSIKLMSEVKVVKRFSKEKKTNPQQYKGFLCSSNSDIEVVCIGASTGGPPVLKTILSEIPADFPKPILVVQHISPNFLKGMINWLQPFCQVSLVIPQEGEIAEGGKVYFAPENKHMGIDKNKKIFLSDEPPEHCVKPSVSFLFRSALRSFGNKFLAVLLTGMGKDGAEETAQLHRMNGVTIIQDKQSSVVFGMPGEAIRLGAGRYILPPEKIPEAIINQICRKEGS